MNIINICNYSCNTVNKYCRYFAYCHTSRSCEVLWWKLLLLAFGSVSTNCAQKYSLGYGWWTGGHQAVTYSSKFVWRSSEQMPNDGEMTYLKWHSNQPNSLGSVPVCVCMMSFRPHFAWDDCTCTDEFCSLCELDIVNQWRRCLPDLIETKRIVNPPTIVGWVK